MDQRIAAISVLPVEPSHAVIRRDVEDIGYGR